MSTLHSASRPRSIGAVTTVAEVRHGPGFRSFGLRGIPGFSMDPFLNLDDFHMSQPTFPPHPHAGFSAVTYMFEDSAGGFVNRDSLGDRSRIGPGALHWTQAARGMLHEEIPERPGVDCHGLQMFVKLRAAHEHADPRAFHLDADQIPVVTTPEGARVRVVCGSLGDTSSPLRELLTPIQMLDVQLPAGAPVVLPVEPEHTCFLLVIAGSGEVVGPTGDGRPIAAHMGVGLARDGGVVSLRATNERLHALVLAAAPLHEPVVFGGPFAMTRREDVTAAFARYQRGEMGALSPSF